MDNLTHTLTGLALSRAGLNRLCPRASLIAMLAANAPDLDIVTGVISKPLYLDYHRHATHSLFLIPLIALIAVLLARLFGPVLWFRAWIVAMVGVLSHVLMDWTNIYGIRILWPFSSDWLRLDITPVVDPWLLAVLCLAAIAPWFSRMVGSEIGDRRKEKHPGTALAAFAVTFLLVYNYGRFVLHERVVAILDSRLHDGAVPARVAAIPDFVSPLKWTGLVQLDGEYRIYPLTIGRTFDPSSGQLFVNSSNAAMKSAALGTPAFQAFQRFAQFPLWQVTPGDVEGTMRVQLYDLRFGNPQDPGFVSTAIIDQSGRALESSFTFGDPKSR